MATPRITLHWLENSRAQRMVWLLEELELPYELKTYKRDPKTKLAPPELKAVHPLGKSPIITIEEPNSNKLTLAESGAATEYLIERFGNGKLGVPANSVDAEKRFNYLYWLHWAEGTAMTANIVAVIFGQLPKQAPFFIRPILNTLNSAIHEKFINPRHAENYALVEAALAKGPYLLGEELTGADIMISYPIEVLEDAPGGFGKYPNIAAWKKLVDARPAYIRGLQKGAKNDPNAFR